MMKKGHRNLPATVPENTDIGRILYFAALIPYLTARVWESTMFQHSGRLNQAAVLFCAAVLIVRILFYMEFTLKELVLYGLCLATGAVSFLHGGSIHFTILILLLMAGRGIERDDILKCCVSVAGVTLALTFFGFLLGIAEDVRGVSKDEFLGLSLARPHSLGFCSPTDLAARCFFLFLALLNLKRESKWLPLAAVPAALILFLITHGRLDCGCMLLASLLWILDRLVSRTGTVRFRRFWKKAWGAAGFLAMPFAALLSLGACRLYSGSSAVMRRLDVVFSSRLRLGKHYFDLWDITLFGQDIEMVGNGGIGQELIARGQGYTFIDISYQQVLLLNGVLALIIIVVIWMLTARRNRNDTFMMYTVVLISVNCMVAHHLLDFSYIPFVAALTAADSRIGKPSGQIICNVLPPEQPEDGPENSLS